MFDRGDVGKYKATKSVVLNILDDEVGINGEEYKPSCTYPDDVKVTLKASFQFIKDNPVVIDGKTQEVYITIDVFLKENENEEENNFNYAITSLSGVVKEVYDSYAVLEAKRESGKSFDIKVIYEKIVYFGHITIRKNFESYVDYINKNAALCKDCYSEGYNLLVRLAKILGKNDPKERNFIFILGKVLTREIEAKNISILRNLIVVEELFINPITSIQGFSQIPNEN